MRAHCRRLFQACLIILVARPAAAVLATGEYGRDSTILCIVGRRLYRLQDSLSFLVWPVTHFTLVLTRHNLIHRIITYTAVIQPYYNRRVLHTQARCSMLMHVCGVVGSSTELRPTIGVMKAENNMRTANRRWRRVIRHSRFTNQDCVGDT
jgi:hypothetical protein